MYSQNNGSKLPFEFLQTSSSVTLNDYELSRLNRAAILRKELRTLLEELVDNLAQAEFARLMQRHRKRLK
jgi:hypothetical protein